jgi:malate dehydrogenase
MQSAKGVPRERFSAMTRLDQNRMQAQLAIKAKVAITEVKNALIWGNHSATQVPDFYNATIGGKSAATVIGDEAWLKGEFTKTVQQRGAAIIAARGVSSAMSAANALIDHVRDLVNPTPKDEWRSVCVCSDGSYGVPEGLISSFPVRADGKGNWQIVQGLAINAYLGEKLAASVTEIQGEREIVKHLVA